jgi:hypothetical protein
MTITFPREFPDDPFEPQRIRFDREPLGAISRSQNGRLAFQEFVGGGLWEALYQTKPLIESRAAVWHAWKLSLRGPSGTFKAHDTRRCYPIFYGPSVLTLTRFGGGVFNGSVSVTAVTGETISLGGPLFLPASFIFRAGDYVSFAWLGGQHLVRILEDTNANASGAATLTVDPWLRTGGTLPATGTIVKAWCSMKIKPGTWQGERTNLDPVAFEAIQHLT